MARVLVLFAHPGQRHSKINLALANAARSAEGVTFADLYAEYPQFKIDIDREQARLLEHDALVFQFPIYWYSTPSLLKEWQDLVLEYGFAYGTGGNSLKDKLFLPVVTAGGPQEAYSEQGYNHFPLRTLLSPLEQTANLCQMRYVPPLAIFAAQRAGNDGRGEAYVAAYRRLLGALCRDRFDLKAAQGHELLSDVSVEDLLGD